MKTTILQKAPLFSAMDKDTISYFENGSHKKHCAKGEELFSMGDTARNFYFILEGWIKLYRITSEGEEAIIHIFGPGETFAEAAVFNERQRYPVSAQAIEKTDLLEVPRQLFINKIHEDSDFALSILGSIAARQHFLVQQIEQVTVKSAPQRIGTFLIRLCKQGETENVEIKLPYDKGLIARRLNLQPETFSRALSKLKPYGVTINGRSITIHDIGTLANFCDMDERDIPC